MKRRNVVGIAKALHDENMVILRLVCLLAGDTDKEMIEQLIGDNEIKFLQAINCINVEEADKE